MRKKTKIAIILDRSGSMKGIREQTIKGYNDQIQSLREEASNPDSGETTVSLIIFEGEVMPSYFERSINFLTDMKAEDYNPDKGWTAMNDAVGYTIERLLKETDSEDPDTAYLVVIISDGQENKSKKWTSAALAELIQKVQATKRWTFTYLGANQDLSKVQDTLGLEHSNMARWSSSRGGSAYAMAENSKMTKKYMKARQAGATQVTNLYSDKDEIADFTVQPDTTFKFGSNQGKSRTNEEKIISDVRHMIDKAKDKDDVVSTSLGLHKPKKRIEITKRPGHPDD